MGENTYLELFKHSLFDYQEEGHQNENSSSTGMVILCPQDSGQNLMSTMII